MNVEARRPKSDWVKQEGLDVLTQVRPPLIEVRQRLLDAAWNLQPLFRVNPDLLVGADDLNREKLPPEAKAYLEAEDLEAVISEQIVTGKVSQMEGFNSPNFDYRKINLYNREAEEKAVASNIEYGKTKGIPATFSEWFMRTIRIPKSKEVQTEFLDHLAHMAQKLQTKVQDAEEEKIIRFPRRSDRSRRAA